MKTGYFPSGEEPAERDDRSEIARRFAHEHARVIASPACVARETAGWITTDFSIDPAFDDIDFARWRGRSVRDIGEREPENIAAWLSDPHANPHGGESIAMLSTRVNQALDRLASGPERACIIVVTHAIVLKTALSAVSGLSLKTALKMDLAPLSSETLIQCDGKWTLLPS